MTKPLTIREYMGSDHLAEQLSDKWVTWDGSRVPWKNAARELRDYLFATDTRTTSNSKLPWKNSTTVPKLTFIRDTLHAHYMAAIFPNDDWFVWQARDEASNNKDKSKAITSYMKVKLDQSAFRTEVSRLIYDYIDYGNCFAQSDFRREVNETDGRILFEGPIQKRISPYDIVFDPTVERFSDSPTIVRSYLSVAELLVKIENDPGLNYDKEVVMKLVGKKRELRSYPRTDIAKMAGMQIDGFGSSFEYVNSDTVELLEFQGDWFDVENGTLHRNQIITVIDRVYILRQIDNDSYMKNNIFHVGWRLRPDNLWAMGPLENLVGMQYRLDHIENAKADAVDEYIHPKVKIRGYVEDFGNGPGERIFMGDDGDVTFERPDLGFLQYDQEMSIYMGLMEEMAGAPKDLAGIRTPGNKTLTESNQLHENSQRVLLNKSSYFEENLLEKLLNSMLDIAVRRMAPRQEIAIPNEELGTVEFMEITPDDLSGNGLIRPIGARRFQTQERLLQNLTAFSGSPLGQDPAVSVHISGLRIAQLMEELLGVERWNLVRPNVRVAEQAETQRQAQAASEEVEVEGTIPTELTDEDVIDQEEI